jgi:hypothetical protein
MTSLAESRSQPPLAPPRGAALSGVIFGILTIVGLGLVRYAIPANPNTPGTWLSDPFHRSAVRFALKLVPFAGIAFLWFIGVLRNRLADLEDRFFATIFLGSGLLFIATLFASATVTDALVRSIGVPNVESDTYFFGRCISDSLFNLFGMKMAGVFMFSTCTVALRTAIFSRWIAYTGFACAILLLLIIADWEWITLIFPAWMLLVSGQILLVEVRSRNVGMAGAKNSLAGG